MKNLLTFLLINLVNNQDDVEVIEEEGEFSTEYMIRVHQDDVGLVIGKNGRIIQAIRTLVKVRAMKENRHINVSLLNE